ncbi:MAG: zinc ribbon domain-containing protein [Archaeoglobaceae archaeon]|nr:zinc ribbon domain-containing protein [Archaeoglobaceae archaeon]MDW7989538.1 zinc ribbon domain-containing protein [Archaeoglobaceae archaeon]
MIVESRELKLKNRIPVTRIAKYWEGLKEGKVFKTVCKCGMSYYPPKADCVCGNQTEWVEIVGEGIVESFTVVHSIPACFEWGGVYRIVIAKFEDVRVMGWSEEDVKIGERVSILTKKDASGIWKVWFEKR